MAHDQKTTGPDWSRPVMRRNGQRVEVVEVYADDHPRHPGEVCIHRLDEPQPMAALWWVPKSGVATHWPGGQLDIVNVPEVTP